VCGPTIWVEQYELVRFNDESQSSFFLNLLLCKILENLLERSLGHRVFRDIDICLLVLDQTKKVANSDVSAWDFKLVEVRALLKKLYTFEDLREVLDDPDAVLLDK
jgi:hypothetical protein